LYQRRWDTAGSEAVHIAANDHSLGGEDSVYWFVLDCGDEFNAWWDLSLATEERALVVPIGLPPPPQPSATAGDFERLPLSLGRRLRPV
jgi:hypothetical protein